VRGLTAVGYGAVVPAFGEAGCEAPGSGLPVRIPAVVHLQMFLSETGGWWRQPETHQRDILWVFYISMCTVFDILRSLYFFIFKYKGKPCHVICLTWRGCSRGCGASGSPSAGRCSR